MPRIPYRDPAQLPADLRAIVEEHPSNVTRMMATASEPVFRACWEQGAILLTQSSVPPKLRELAILRVGYLSNARYEIFQHEALARHVGLSEAEIDAIRHGDPDGVLAAEQRAVLEFVDDVVRNVRAGDATLAAVREHLDDSQVVDLITVFGMYMMVCRLLETTGVELDGEPADWNAVIPGRDQ